MIIDMLFNGNVVCGVVLARAVFIKDSIGIVLPSLKHPYSQDMIEDFAIRLTCYTEWGLQLSGKNRNIDIGRIVMQIIIALLKLDIVLSNALIVPKRFNIVSEFEDARLILQEYYLLDN